MQNGWIPLGRRVHITPLAREIKSGTVGSCGYTFPEDFDSYDAEWKALIAVFIDRVVDRATAGRPQHPPYGLVRRYGIGYRPVTSLDTSDPFVSLGLYISGTLYHGLEGEMEFLEDLLRDDSATGGIKAAYARYKAINSYADENGNIRSRENLGTRIEDGINSATDAMSGVLKVIPEVYKRGAKRKPTAPVLVNVAQNSFPLVAELAMVHIDFIAYLMDALRKRPIWNGNLYRPLDPKYFTLKEHRNGLGITIHEDARPVLKKRLEEWWHGADLTPKTARTGCPAMADFDEGSAVKRLWDWHIEIAEEIYRNLYPAVFN